MSAANETLIQVVTLIAMLVGLFGLIIPIFPGLFVIWLAAFVYGLLTGFTAWAVVLFVIISALSIVGSLVDNVLMGAKARESGAAWSSVTIGIVAGLLGSIIVPILGGPIASLGGLYAAEYFRRRRSSENAKQEAWFATRSMAIGCGWAFLARFGIGMLMIGLWLIWALAL